VELRPCLRRDARRRVPQDDVLPQLTSSRAASAPAGARNRGCRAAFRRG
jgi:hypothetical protein